MQHPIATTAVLVQKLLSINFSTDIAQTTTMTEILHKTA